MKIKRTNKTTLIAVVSLLLIAGALAATYFFFAYQNKDTSPVRSQSDIEQAEDLAKNPDNKSLSPNSDQPSTPPSTPTPSGKKNIPMIASTNTSNATLYIRGGLSYPVLEDGSCYALLTGPGGASIRKDTEILQNPASTDCKTVSLPVQELAKGPWKATLNYSSTNYEGTSNEVEFTVN